jgi:alpha/beta hydrolase family protein
VPAAALSGTEGGAFGVMRPFDDDRLARLYPNGATNYLELFEQSLDTAISDGFRLADDRTEMLGLAAAASSDRFVSPVAA